MRSAGSEERNQQKYSHQDANPAHGNRSMVTVSVSFEEKSGGCGKPGTGSTWRVVVREALRLAWSRLPSCSDRVESESAKNASSFCVGDKVFSVPGVASPAELHNSC